MENKHINDLRWKLQQMSTQQLEEMLRTEAEKETPDDDLVLTSLQILKERNAIKPVDPEQLTPEAKAAWEDYKQKVKAREEKPMLRLPRFVKAASIVLVLLGLCLVYLPQQAQAGSFWKILANFTDSVFEFVNIGGKETEPEGYVFATDNPGLQQVYDAVVEYLEITEPVVVKWLPEGSELAEIRQVETRGKKAVHAYFRNEDKEIILAFNKMEADRSPQYYKAAGDIIAYEVNGIVYNYMKNDNVWVVNWAIHNLKCTICIDCQEDVLQQIIQSIY